MKKILSIIAILFLCVSVSRCADLGEWTYSRRAAEELADTWDRPLVIKFSNSSGKCALCNSFDKHINCSDYWKAYASEQQLAMYYIDYNRNWDMGCYLNVISNNPAVTSFPAFAIYASDGSTLLEAFTYSADETYTAEAFVERINDILEENGYLLEGNDLWDPLDNTATGATILDFELFNKRQYHDLNETADDTVDWFKFKCGRSLFKLHLPPADYNIDFAGTTDSYLDSVTNNYYEAVTNSTVAATVTNTYYSVTTNVISVTTNVVLSAPNSLYPFTNGLPRLVLVSQTATGPTTTTGTVSRQTGPFATNFPGNPPLIVTNGVPKELVAPMIQLFDPDLTTPLEFTLGGSVVTNLAYLNQLEDGLVFSAPQPCSGEFFFVRIGQELEGELPYFETIEYYDLTTNTTVTVQTNFTETAVITTTTTNFVRNWITFSGVTNYYVPDFPVGYSVDAVKVHTNRVNETYTTVISNNAARSVAQTTTVQEIYEGSNYVFYSYSRTQYTLNYRLWEPGVVGFEQPALAGRETAENIKVRVVREGGSTGEARFAYSFEDVDTAGPGYTAENGTDFHGVNGELVWIDGEDGVKEILVPLIQDVVPLWEGDETFAVVMTGHTDAAVLQAPLATDRCVVTLRESASRQPGEVSFFGSSADDTSVPVPFAVPRSPDVKVREGEGVTLWLQRMNGGNGAISVRVTTKSGTAQEGVSFEPLSEIITWLDGETDPKPVNIETYEIDGFTDELHFTVEVALEQDAKIGQARRVKLRLRDVMVARTFGDTADAAAAAALAFRSTGDDWFWSDAGAISSAPLTDGSRKFTLALEGPGVLTFDWTVNDLAPGDTLTLEGGVAAVKSLAVDGPSISALIPDGRRVLTWTLTAGSTTAGRELYATIANMVWKPVPSALDPSPPAGGQTFEDDLAWRMPQTYAVALDGDFAVDELSGLSLNARVTGLSPAGNVVDDAAGTTVTALWGHAGPLPGQSYRWQVATCFEHPDGEALNPGDVWSFKGIAGDDAEITAPPPDGIGASGAYETVQGVFADLGEIYDADDGISVKVAGGKLPSGLRIDSRTGRISGVPSRAGTESLLLQATARVDGANVPFATIRITIRVNPMGELAGSYTGWMIPSQGTLIYEGAVTLSLSESGRMTAKCTVAGGTLAFSRTGADGVDDPAAVSLLYFNEVDGPYVTDVDGTRLYSRLSDLTLHADGGGTAVLTRYSAKGSGSQRVVEETVFDVVLRRNDWASETMRPLAEAFEGYYTALLPVTATGGPFAPWGTGFLSLTVNGKGSVKVAGNLADGTRISFSTILLYLDAPLEGQVNFAGEEAFVYLFHQPRNYGGIGGVSGFLKIIAGQQPQEGIIDEADERLQWWNREPHSIYGGGGEAPGDGTGFLNRLAPAGGYFDKRTNLQTYYLERSLTFEDSADYPGEDLLPADNDGYDGDSGYLLYADILPFGTPLTIGAYDLSAPKKMVAGLGGDEDGDFEDEDFEAADGSSEFDNIDIGESVNLNNLSISLNRNSGLIQGRFELYYERENQDGTFSQRTGKIRWNGIMTRNHPLHDPDEQNSGIQGGGFYLLKDTGSWLDDRGYTKNYSFDWSYPFELQSGADE